MEVVGGLIRGFRDWLFSFRHVTTTVTYNSPLNAAAAFCCDYQMNILNSLNFKNSIYFITVLYLFNTKNVLVLKLCTYLLQFDSYVTFLNKLVIQYIINRQSNTFILHLSLNIKFYCKIDLLFSEL